MGYPNQKPGSDDVYGFKPDVAWNYGLNFSQDFNLDYRPGSMTFDYFFTDFENQVVLDLDQSAREANFYGCKGNRIHTVSSFRLITNSGAGLT